MFAYYIAFRLLDDGVDRLREYLRAAATDHLAVLTSQNTPPSNMHYSEIVDMFVFCRLNIIRRTAALAVQSCDVLLMNIPILNRFFQLRVCTVIVMW